MSQSFEEFRGQIPQNSSNIGLGKGTGLKGNFALLVKTLEIQGISQNLLQNCNLRFSEP